MIIIKWVFLGLIFGTSLIIGFLISKKYSNRVEILKEFKNAINILETKMKFTYEPLREIFDEISNLSSDSISNIFLNANKKMENLPASDAWQEAVSSSNLDLKDEDINVLSRMGKMLGKTDLEGQVSEIELTLSFLDNQIKNAEEEKTKNSKLYKTLGVTLGLAIIIILM